MCGRYTLDADSDELIEAFDLPGLTFEHQPRYNVAPGQPAPVLAEDRRGRRMGQLVWGLVPGWVDEPGSGHVNARAETVEERASFREAFARRRCLVPATGFYEWKRQGGGKVPYWLHPTGGRLVTFAAIWERWSRPGHEPRHTFAILTTDANRDVRDIHDRMPVLVAEEDRDTWIGRDADLSDVRELLHPPPPGTLAGHAVSTRVNRPAEDGAGLIEPLE